jgi:hypothetical protein
VKQNAEKKQNKIKQNKTNKQTNFLEHTHKIDNFGLLND